jgi:hypothetical protein
VGLGAKLCTAFLALFAAAIIVISAIYLDRTADFRIAPIVGEQRSRAREPSSCRSPWESRTTSWSRSMICS